MLHKFFTIFGLIIIKKDTLSEIMQAMFERGIEQGKEEFREESETAISNFIDSIKTAASGISRKTVDKKIELDPYGNFGFSDNCFITDFKRGD
jgi:hypothetical protein